MADSIFTTETPPDSASGGGTSSNRGVRWQNTGADKVIRGGRVWVHSTGIPDGSEWQIWDLSIFDKVLTRSLDDATGSNEWFDFAVSDFALVQDRYYYVCVFYPAVSYTYVYDDEGTFPASSGGDVYANAGVERVGGSINDPPDSIFPGYYFADVTVDEASSAMEASGTAVTAVTGTTAVRKVSPANGRAPVFAAGTAAAGKAAPVTAVSPVVASATAAGAKRAVSAGTTTAAPAGSVAGMKVVAASAICSAMAAGLLLAQNGRPGTLTPSGTAATLAASATSTALAAGGTAATLTASGTP